MKKQIVAQTLLTKGLVASFYRSTVSIILFYCDNEFTDQVNRAKQIIFKQIQTIEQKRA